MLHHLRCTRARACFVLCMLLLVANARATVLGQSASELAEPRVKVPKRPQIENLVSETHAAVPDRVFMVESVLRVVGRGFGRSQEGASLELRVPSLPSPLSLQVLSWRDDEVRLRLPRAVDLGVDPATAELLRKELSDERRFVAIETHLALMRGDHVVEAEEPVRVVVVASDLDGDGAPRESDRDDFDPKVK